MARHKCDKCDKSFEKEHGLNVHINRIHNLKARAAWGTGTGKKTTTAAKTHKKKNVSVRDRVRLVLAKHPEGLQVQNIITKLKGNGYRPSGDASTLISQTCSVDPKVTRVERGVYRLTNSEKVKQDIVDRVVTKSVESAPEAIDQQITHGAEVLLLRVDQLERENRALRNAHLMFVREIGE